MDGDELIEAWREALNSPQKSWVLFENGTCVILMAPEEDLEAQAIALLREYGPVQIGTPAADFSTITLKNGSGWVVTCHHQDILTFVGPDEIDPQPDNLLVGLLGRSKRDQDAELLSVLHVEDRRSA